MARKVEEQYAELSVRFKKGTLPALTKFEKRLDSIYAKLKKIDKFQASPRVDAAKVKGGAGSTARVRKVVVKADAAADIQRNRQLLQIAKMEKRAREIAESAGVSPKTLMGKDVAHVAYMKRKAKEGRLTNEELGDRKTRLELAKMGLSKEIEATTAKRKAALQSQKAKDAKEFAALSEKQKAASRLKAAETAAYKENTARSKVADRAAAARKRDLDLLRKRNKDARDHIKKEAAAGVKSRKQIANEARVRRRSAREFDAMQRKEYNLRRSQVMRRRSERSGRGRTVRNERIRVKSSVAYQDFSTAKQARYLRQMTAINNAYRFGDIDLEKYKDSLAALNYQFDAGNRRVRKFRRGFLALATAVAVGVAGRSLIEAGVEMEGLEASMLLVSGSAPQAAKDMEFVRKTANSMGRELTESARGFVKLGVAAKGRLTDGQSKDLFSGFSKFATATGTDNPRFEKGLQALTQMLGKGQIMAEELRQQMGEQIPGSLQIFAEAAGFGKDGIDELFKAVEKGDLKLTGDMAEALARGFSRAADEGGAFAAQQRSMRASFARTSNAVTDFKNAMLKSGIGKGLVSISNVLTSLINGLARFDTLGKTIGLTMMFMSLPIHMIIDAFKILNYVIDRLVGDKASGITKFVSGLFAASTALIASVMAFRSLIGMVSWLNKLLKVTVILQGIITTLAILAGLATGGRIGGGSGMGKKGAPKGGPRSPYGGAAGAKANAKSKGMGKQIDKLSRVTGKLSRVLGPLASPQLAAAGVVGVGAYAAGSKLREGPLTKTDTGLAINDYIGKAVSNSLIGYLDRTYKFIVESSEDLTVRSETQMVDAIISNTD